MTRNPPNDFYSNAEEWMKEYCKNKSNIGRFYRKIYPPKKMPENIPNCPLPTKYPKELIGASITSIPRGRFYGQGAVITPNNKLLYDASSIRHVKFANEHFIFEVKKLPPVEKSDETIAINYHPGNKNYYHWMYQVLPRFLLLKKANISFDKILLKNYGSRFQTETLNKIDVPENKIIAGVKNPELHIRAKKLIIPTLPMNLYPSYWAWELLREKLLNESTVKKESLQRIYIKRNNNSSRTVVNEDQVLQLLKKYHFKSVSLETMSVEEQIITLNSSEFVVGPHGAGLTNLTFCNPGTKVIEIFSPTYLKLHYWLISYYGKLDYHYLIGDASYPKDLPDNQRIPKDDDIIVDCDELELLLQKLL